MNETLRRLLEAVPALAICGGLAVGSARGEPLARVPAPRMLTLREAMKVARQKAPAVLTALAQLEAAEGQVQLTRAGLAPSISATVTAGVALQDAQGAAAGPAPCLSGSAICPAVGGPSRSVDGEALATARWTLWDFGRTRLKVRAGEFAAAGSRSDLAEVEQSAMAGAATAYYTLLADQAAVVASRETLHQRQRQLDIARDKVDAGTSAPVDALRAEIAVQTSRLDLATSEAAVETDAASLAATLGLDPAIPILGIAPPEVPIDDDPARAADAAVTARPAVAAAQARDTAASLSVAAARTAWRPSIVTTGTASAFRTSYVGAGTATTEALNGTIGLSLSLFDPTFRSNVAIARANAGMARADVALQELQARRSAVEAALGVRAARRQVDLAQRNVALNAANLKMDEARYMAGTAALLELVDAQTQDATARLTLIQRELLLERAKVSLLLQTGRLSALEQ